MKLLIVTQYFWPENFRINDLALGLQERRHKVEVLTGFPNYPTGHLFRGYGFLKQVKDNYQNIPIYRVPLILRGSGTGFRLALNFISFALAASLLAPLYCRGKYDVILVYEPSPISVGMPAMVMKWLKKIPVMFWVQDLWPESLSATGAIKSEFILNQVKKLVRFIYRNCDRILIQSLAFRKSVVSHGGVDEKINYFPNSAEALYKPVELEDEAPERKMIPEGFCVMFAGNIGVAQDFPTILGAAEKLRSYKDIHWVIIGDGRMRVWVAEQIQKRGLTRNFHLLGRHPVETMPRFFSLSDVLLVTLRKEPIFSLTIPAKIQSYMACAKPVIAAIDGEGARIIKVADAGLGCSAENPEALAETVLDIYRKNPAERNRIGQNGLAYFRRQFEREILLSRLDSWIRILKEKR